MLKKRAPSLEFHAKVPPCACRRLAAMVCPLAGTFLAIVATQTLAVPVFTPYILPRCNSNAAERMKNSAACFPASSAPRWCFSQPLSGLAFAERCISIAKSHLRLNSPRRSLKQSEFDPHKLFLGHRSPGSRVILRAVDANRSPSPHLFFSTKSLQTLAKLTSCSLKSMKKNLVLLPGR